MNLYEKLLKVRESVIELKKDTEGYGYNYVSGAQILSKINPKLDELGVMLIPMTSDQKIMEYEYTNAKQERKKEVIVWGDMSYMIVDTANPEDKLIVPWSFYGQMDDAAKAYGAALTYAERYFWLKVLRIPTDEDDPDSKDTRGKSSSTPKATYQDAEKVFKKQTQSTGKKKITGPQQKRLIALAGGDMGLIAKLLDDYGIEDISEIHMGSEYETICSDAQAESGVE